MLSAEATRRFVDCATSLDDGDLIVGALCLPLIEYPSVDEAAVLRWLTRLGTMATARLERLGARPSPQEQIDLLNTLLFDEEGLRGNDERHDDPRNSFLDCVLERRTGLPITLAVVYMDVARRAGIPIEGVNFPGHFLVRYRASAHRRDHPRDLILDPFHAGALLGESDLRALLQRHAGEDAVYDRRLLATASRVQILTRMAVNLKRVYVGMRSFPQARAAADLLLALNPLSLNDLRDRGLLAYHLRDLAGALRDLEAYLQASARAGPPAEDQRQEVQQIWEHVKTLRRRLAGFN